MASLPTGIHAALAGWYTSHARDLPWRRTADPYAILTAEVMLQQTQVDRVIPKYRQFMEAFPTLAALAHAALADVIRVWAPLGYNARAVRLHRLAVRVVEEYGGQLPQTVQQLRALPGIGPYTAAAVACFAFGATVPVLDTNIYRVLSRVAYGVDPPSRREIERLAGEWLPAEGASVWHQALMDVGATLCVVTRPRCLLCPLRMHCRAAPYLQSNPPRGLAEASVPYAPTQGRYPGSSRYFRGRIVEALRALPTGDHMELADLGHAVHQGYEGEKHLEWLRGLVAGLERDGLVHVEPAEMGRVRVSLP